MDGIPARNVDVTCLYLPDGRHVLYIVTDNDLFPGLPTQIYAFAIDEAAAKLDYRPQQLPGALFPPGQVKKALK